VHLRRRDQSSDTHRDPAASERGDILAVMPTDIRTCLAHLPPATAFAAWAMARHGCSAAWLRRHLDLDAGDAHAIVALVQQGRAADGARAAAQ
jgi:hypothetical protein